MAKNAGVLAQSRLTDHAQCAQPALSETEISLNVLDAQGTLISVPHAMQLLGNVPNAIQTSIRKFASILRPMSALKLLARVEIQTYLCFAIELRPLFKFGQSI